MPSRAAISLIGLRVAACAISISERTAFTCRCSHLGGQILYLIVRRSRFWIPRPIWARLSARQPTLRGERGNARPAVFGAEFHEAPRHRGLDPGLGDDEIHEHIVGSR